MDKEENENEIKQVIGDTYRAHDLSESELIIFGKSGVLITDRTRFVTRRWSPCIRVSRRAPSS